MKKRIILIGLILVAMVFGTRSVFASDSPLVFTICNVNGDHCEDINEENVDTDHVYDNFELKHGVVYLNNANIQMTIYDIIEINVTGTNKITKFINTTDNGISEGEGYIPFTIAGDGYLEIEKYNKYNTNELGEIYYKRWGSTNKKSISINEYWAQITENDKPLIRFSIPETGWTLSDIATLVDEDNTLADEGKKGYMVIVPANEAYLNNTINTELESIRWESLVETVSNHSKAYEETTGIVLNTKETIEYYIGEVFEAIHPVTTPTKIDTKWSNEVVNTSLKKSLSEDGVLRIGEKPIVLVDTIETEDVTFESNEGIDATYSLKTEDITDKLSETQITSVEEKSKKALLQMYEINILDKDNQVVDMKDGSYTIRIKLGDLLKRHEKFDVVYISDENEVEVLDSKVVDDFIEFTTTHLSKYGIVGTSKIIDTSNAPASVPTTTSITNPKTLDNIYVNVIIFITLGFIISVAIVKLKGINLRRVR